MEFEVGGKAVKEFRMIERHYYKDRLLKSFDFNFGFCIPKSRNTCEQIYEFPTLDDKTSGCSLSNLSIDFLLKNILGDKKTGISN